MRRMRAFTVNREERPQARSRQNKIWPPWEDSNFKLGPSLSELEGMRDGQTWKKTALVRFLEPDEGPYRYRQSFVGGRYRISTADHPDFGGRDVIHHYWSQSEYGEDDYRNLSQKMQYALELVDFRYFHSEVVDGKMIYHECDSSHPKGDPRRCKMCESGMDRLFGGHKAWSLSEYRYNQLMDVHSDLQNICINDDEELFGKEIFPGTIGFSCASCDTELKSEKELQVMPSAEKESFYLSKHTCPECGANDYAKEIAIIERANGEAVEAERGSMFDKLLKITATGEKTTINGRARTNPRSINYTITHEGQEFSNLEQDLVDMGMSDEDLDEVLKPMDLKWHYRPEMLDPAKFDSTEDYVQEVLDRQASAVNRENPYKNDVPKSMSYNNGNSTNGSSKSWRKR